MFLLITKGVVAIPHYKCPEAAHSQVRLNHSYRCPHNSIARRCRTMCRCTRRLRYLLTAGTWLPLPNCVVESKLVVRVLHARSVASVVGCNRKFVFTIAQDSVCGQQILSGFMARANCAHHNRRQRINKWLDRARPAYDNARTYDK
jgi:hypothetical protein